MKGFLRKQEALELFNFAKALVLQVFLNRTDE